MFNLHLSNNNPNFIDLLADSKKIFIIDSILPCLSCKIYAFVVHVHYWTIRVIAVQPCGCQIAKQA